jgi:hypothetical protein
LIEEEEEEEDANNNGRDFDDHVWMVQHYLKEFSQPSVETMEQDYLPPPDDENGGWRHDWNYFITMKDWEYKLKVFKKDGNANI